ncbi:hypothetical protein [Azospirillum rugosum]|uniref:O-antigen ligase like membrane protein n=1 Tax=Azospirillum rugosum TaxID=416170 RepID=A0ABS4SWT7_9PROT|nr:hypothetical protein [Azospirillum rugosum]MBP2296719.1 hypothetical protein [Azospirillum rugosum]MDQ0530468.1 hypothetical protein [Azospirillum rugosum]
MAASLRALGLFLALALYGLFSAPAPPDIRMAEAGIGLLLLLAIGLRRPLYVATAHALRDPRLAGWETPAVLALAWLLWVPVLRGAWVGWAPGDMLRDVVPLLYLFLPVLLVPLLKDDAEVAVRLLRWGLMLAGAAFALRWWKQAHWGFGAVGLRAMADGGVYLLNAPSVLFAGIALPLTGVRMATRGGLAQRFAGAACLALGLLCLAALAGAVHRMALGLAAAAFLAVGAWQVRRAPLAVGLGLLAVAGVVLAFPDMVVGALMQVAEKNRLAGANTRWEEAAAVVALTIADLGSFLFGQGWGALIANPAVGGWRVSYTHTLPTYALAKTGVLGALALCAYILALAPRTLQALRRDPPLAWAVLPPLVMAFCVHTSFKYLDTGLLLTLLLLAAERRNALSSS